MLLRAIDNGGYPFEYLLARIMVRRGRLITDWQSIVNAADPLASIPAGSGDKNAEDRSVEQIWNSLLSEYSWIYGQMDEVTKRIFAPFFICIELKTLIICLRCKVENKRAKIPELLTVSLLSETVKKILAGERDAFDAVAAVEKALMPFSDSFRGLRETFRNNGLAGLEQALTNTWLEHASETEHHPVLRDFIRSLVDFRNLLNLYKRLHWEMPGPASFLKGGVIGKARLEEVLTTRQPEGIEALLHRFPGVQGEIDASGNPEHLLLREMTRCLRIKSREPSGFGLVLDYLWRLYIETVNLGILCHWRSFDRATIAMELII